MKCFKEEEKKLLPFVILWLLCVSRDSSCGENSLLAAWRFKDAGPIIRDNYLG